MKKKKKRGEEGERERRNYGWRSVRDNPARFPRAEAKTHRCFLANQRARSRARKEKNVKSLVRSRLALNFPLGAKFFPRLALLFGRLNRDFAQMFTGFRLGWFSTGSAEKPRRSALEKRSREHRESAGKNYSTPPRGGRRRKCKYLRCIVLAGVPEHSSR